tara:strand:- start:4294 stop:4452 length:159 start_codon:yes stop_codon:yes gene_type:complete
MEIFKGIWNALKPTNRERLWFPVPKYASSPEQKQEFIYEIMETLNNNIIIKK